MATQVHHYYGVLFILWMMTFSNSLAQIQVSGRVLDDNHQPLPYANIVVKGTAMGTIASADGFFHLNIPWDSATLEFSFVGYSTVLKKVTKSDTLEVRMVGLKIWDHYAWPLKERSERPIMKRKDKSLKVYTYSIDSFPLVNTLTNTRWVAWYLHGYRVYVPIDSLVKRMEESGHSFQSELNFLRVRMAMDTVLLPSGFLEQYSILTSVALSMISKKAILIADQRSRRLEFIEIRQVTAVYRKKNMHGGHYLWAGLEFWVKGGRQPLFEEVHLQT